MPSRSPRLHLHRSPKRPPTSPRRRLPRTAGRAPRRPRIPPLLPAPSQAGTPTSTAGTDVAPAEAPVTPAIVVADEEHESRQDARIRALERRLQHDERHIRKLEERVGLWKHLRLESFIQPQLLVQTYNSAASPNVQPDGKLPAGIGANNTIAKIDGTTTNGTFFRVRRARMRTFYETDVMRMFLQIDVMPAGGVGPGIGTILRNAEATGIARWTRDVRTELSAGLFFTPFRAELLEPSVTRPFIERTWFIQNVFPTERDYGAKARTIALGDRLVVDVAVVNGQRLGERYFVALPDLNQSKDLVANATYRLGPVTLGANGYLGRGQIVDTQALRFKQYSRWATNVQASAAYHLLRAVGESRLSGELTFTQNMDSGVIYPFAVPAIPANIAERRREHRRARALRAVRAGHQAPRGARIPLRHVHAQRGNQEQRPRYPRVRRRVEDLAEPALHERARLGDRQRASLRGAGALEAHRVLLERAPGDVLSAGAGRVPVSVRAALALRRSRPGSTRASARRT